MIREQVTEAELRRRQTELSRRSDWHSSLPYVGAAILLVLIVYYGVRGSSGDEPVHLVVYAFSTQEEVLTQSVFPAFEEAWEAETGRELSLDGVFGPSAVLAGQINLGAPADIALFSNAHHVTYLRLGKQLRQETQSVVLGYTPMVIVTRPGNPYRLQTFADLSQPGLHLLHANPRSSGGGEWALLVEYGSARLESGSEAEAAAQLSRIWQNVSILAPSARAALTLLELGAGDALVTYEQDALLARERGVALEIVHPPYTIVAEPVAVVVDNNVTRSERPAVTAFMRYLLAPQGQAHFAHYYQRPVMDDAAFVPLSHSFTVADLGGWPQAYRRIVENTWQTEIEPYLNFDVPAVRLPRNHQEIPTE